MRDRSGVERGVCRKCVAADIECCEFCFDPYAGSPGDNLDDESFGSEPPEEVYRRRPLLRSLCARLEAPDLSGSAAAAECSSCGCPAEAHEAVTLASSEAARLEVARGLFAPFDLSLCIRQSVQDTSVLGLQRDGFTYGEVGLLSFLRLLDRVQEIRRCNGAGTSGNGADGGAFYDLGCGAGKAVVLAALHPIAFCRCVGVELLPGLAQIAQALGGRYRGSTASEVGSEVAFVEGDLFDAGLTGAALVLVNAGSWREPSLSRLRRHLLQEMPDSCVLATIRKPLAEAGSTELVPLEEFSLPMSWGAAPVFLAVRRRAQPLVDLNAMD